MARTTMKHVVQLRVIADPDQTESLAKGLDEFFRSKGMTVIDCTPDSRDKFNEDRAKFFMTAMPVNGKGEANGTE